MSDLRSSNIYDMLDEDGGASAAVQPKKDAKSTPAEKPSSKKVDAPAKKENPAKNEEPAAPLGKEQRGVGGRDQKPRGRGRDNKGGLRRPAGTGREFDRRSGPSATHRNPREGKRHGGGQHNWGDPVEEGTKAAQPAEETPASPPAPADENKAETPAATTENKEAEQKEPQEEDDKTLTYEQFLKKKESQAPEGDKLEARPVDNDGFQGVAVKEVNSEKKSKKKGQHDEDKDEENKEKGARKKKNVVTLDEFNAKAPARAPREARPPRTENSERGTSERGARGGRGRGARGGARGGRGRGGGGGAGGGGNRSSQAPVAVDDSNFPKLGK